MQVNGLDHINVVTTQLSETARFYAEVLGLQERDPPPNLDPALIRWMYNPAERPIFHLSSPGSLLDEEPTDRGTSTGPVHHVALDCSDHASALAKVEAMGLARRLNDVPSIALKQIFIEDPNGILLELNFRDGNH